MADKKPPHRGVNFNKEGAPLTNVGLCEEELTVLIDFIDDKEVDEATILGVKRKLVFRRKRLRQRIKWAQSQ